MSIVHFLFLSLLCHCVLGSYFGDSDAISEEIECQCVPSHLCADNDEAANGQGLLDIRFEDENSCFDLHHVCCYTLLEATPLPPTKKCGVSNPNGLDLRITSDSSKTSVGELPWTVLVLNAAPKTPNPFICGGSLIHPQVVITAAHCVATSETEALKVRAGEWNLKNKKEPLPHQDQSVKEILVHPQYKPQILWNDIALLILKQPFSANENIGFICLPAGKFKIDEENCVASGWGIRTLRRKKLAEVLRKVTIPLIGRGTCQKALRSTKLGKGFRLHRSFMCAGGEKNKDTCKGDGGSPLICPIVGEKGRYVQVGVVSWGIGCGGKNVPGVYANVATFGTWMENEMQKRDFNSSYHLL